jgi:hypothetical protein
MSKRQRFWLGAFAGMWVAAYVIFGYYWLSRPAPVRHTSTATCGIRG